MISGFYMSLILRSKYRDVGTFYLNRFLRLYPAYLLITVMTVVMFGATWLYLGKIPTNTWMLYYADMAPWQAASIVLRACGGASRCGARNGHGAIKRYPVLSPSFGVELRPVGVADANEIERGITAFARDPHGALILTNSPAALRHREMIMGLAARHKLPAVYPIASSPPKAAWFPMDRTRSSLTGAPPAMWIASSRARSPANCRSRRR